jgi:hypothetical protein
MLSPEEKFELKKQFTQTIGMVVSQIPEISLPVFLFGMKEVVLEKDYNSI